MPITLDITVETICLIKKASHHTENQYFTTFDSVYYNLQCARTADTALVDSLNCHPLGVLSFSYFWALLNTVGLKTVAMFGNFGLIAIQCLTAWKSRLALVESIKVLLLGFLMVFYSYDLNGQL